MTSCSTFYSKLIRRVYFDRELDGSKHIGALREALPGAALVPIGDKSNIPSNHMRQSTLYVTRDRGSRYGRCPGTPVHRCCNYHTIDVYAGCSLGCSYCIMQSYLNFAPLTVYVDTAGPIAEIRRQALEQPGRFFRIGSGEVGDSLLLDPIFGLTAELIRGLSDLPNVAFEAKTKTSFVDHLLDIGDKGQAVIGFSLNPGAFSDDEGISAPVTERIAAAARAAQAGYRIAFHFDPIVRIDAWEREYAKLIGLLRDIPEEQVAWISMGTIRYTHGLRDRIVSRPYLYDEFVPGKDGKYRYLQRIRTAMYTRILAELRLVFAKAPVYLCMESEAVWERVFGTVPERLPELAHVFDSYALQEVR